MTLFHRSSALSFLLLLVLLAAACTPRGRGGNGGGGDDDDAVGDDDDAVGDDDDAAGDDDDSVADGTLYFGDVSGGLKGGDGGGECNGTAEIRIDDDGVVVDGRLTCGSTCTIQFSGPYAFSEEQFVPSFDCTVNGYTPDLNEFDAWIWGSEGEYAQGNISGYGDMDYFYVSFNAYLEAP